MVFGEMKRPYRTERTILYKPEDGIRGFAFSDKAEIKIKMSNIKTKEKEEKIEELVTEMTEKLKEIIAAD